MCIVATLVLNHVIVILLYLLVAHDLVQLHLAVGQLARVDFLVLGCIVTAHVLHVVHFYLRPFLAVHVIVLSLSMRYSCF